MIDILKGIIDLIKIYIDGIFNFRIEFTAGVYVPLGYIVVAFIFIVIAIYLVFKALGITKGDE